MLRSVKVIEFNLAPLPIASGALKISIQTTKERIKKYEGAKEASAATAYKTKNHSLKEIEANGIY